jgi:pyruvate/2-oxoacid:ferredoxin oxidoreductase alpha subunit
MEEAVPCFDRIEKKFNSIFNRVYGPVEAIHCEDAEIIIVTTGTVTGTCRQVVAQLRARGEKAGLFKLKLFRPFPAEIIRRHLASAQKVAVVDRNFSFGAGGIFAQEIRAALCNFGPHPQVFGFIAGLGGRDITPETLTEIYQATKMRSVPEGESIWIGLNQEIVKSWYN